MQYRTGVIMVLLFFISCSAGCITPPATPVVPTVTTESAINPTIESRSATIPSSDMALQLSDIPADYILRDRSVMVAPDVTQLSRDLGWSQGYSVTFDRVGRLRSDQTRIQQTVNIFPIESMNKIFNFEKVVLSGGEYPFTSPYEIPFPATGDRSAAYRVPDTPSAGQITYTVIFTKKNVFERITMSGTSTDYETLKDIVNKAAEKIR